MDKDLERKIAQAIEPRLEWSRFGRWLLVAALFIALIPVVLTFIQLRRSLELQLVTQYTEPSYQPKNGVLCPGDTLEFTPILLVTRAPVVVKIVSTWWDVDSNRTAMQAKEADTVVSIFRHNGYLTRPTKLVVPDLPPGRYELLRATESTSGSKSTITSVPFVIPATCAP